MRFPIKNPLAGLILRMFNLPTGTILINVWIKVGRLLICINPACCLCIKLDRIQHSLSLIIITTTENQRVDMTLARYPCISERNINCFVFAC